MEPKIEEISRGQWQWKSNQDPWSKSETPQWESFIPKHNYLLEKAYYDQQKEVDLGDYIVSTHDMKQTKKKKTTSQRPVRRINWMESIEEVGRSERFFETELPKTINKIFGSLDDFIRFFSKRNPEIVKFTQSFEEFEDWNDLCGLNNEILPTLVQCLSQNLKVEEDTMHLIRLFKKDFKSFKELYGQILKAYTMNSCLYRNLNQYLRNESWIEIDGLLPYAFCLFKTFSRFKKNNLKGNPSTITLYRGTVLDETALSFYDVKKFPQFSWNSATSTSRSKRIAQHFMFGNADIPNKKYPVMFIIEVPIQNTSKDDLRWIEVSSYSAFPAEDEIILAPGSAFELQEVKIDKNKIAKIFIKMKNETKSLAYRGFMMQGALQSQMLTDPIMRIMCLEGEELSEALEHIFGNKFIENIEFYLCKFNHSSLKKMMQVLPTTEKVNGLNFFSCSNQDEEKVSTPSAQEFENFNIKKLEIFETENFNTIFATPSAHSKHWMSLRELNINFRAIIDNRINHLCWQGLGLLKQLTHLSLELSQCHWLSNEGVSNLCSNGLKYLTQLIHFHLDITQCMKLNDECVHNLCSQGLQHLTRLASLILRINFFSQKSQNITNKAINSLCLNGFKYLTELASLEIHFPSGNEITDEGMNRFIYQGLPHLIRLVSLRITFFMFKQITDEGVKNFFDGVKYLKNLRSLDLDVIDSPLLTDEGVKDLSCQGLKYLTNLKTLKMKFSFCPEVTDQGLNHMFNYGLVHLSQLEVLSLVFFCPEKTITKEGLNNLLSQSLTLAGLKFFSLNDGIYLDTLNQSHLHGPQQKPETQSPSLFVCRRTLEARNEDSFPFWKVPKKLFHKICQMSKQSWSTSNMSRKEKETFKGMKKWISCNKSNLLKVKSRYHPPCETTSLKIDLSQYESKTNEELQNLYSQQVKRLTQLKSLSLDFSQCTQKIYMYRDKTSELCCSRGFQHIIQPTDQQYNIYNVMCCPDQRINILCTQNLQYFTRLKSLHLNFSSNPLRITDVGIKNLCIQGLQHLIQLESLSIDFRMGKESPYIRDEGVHNLGFYGLKYLTQLTSLYLNFTECCQIQVEGINHMLDYGIENLTQLKNLNLDFSAKPGTSMFLPNTINCLGFQKLTQLTSLSLSFASRWLITEKGMENLCLNGLQSLTQLVSLNINFSECNAIYDREVETLCSKGLKYLTQLEYLELNFSTCRVITDQGVNHLCFETLKYLTKLEALELNFRECAVITPFTKQNILRVLRFFGFTVSSY